MVHYKKKVWNEDFHEIPPVCLSVCLSVCLFFYLSNILALKTIKLKLLFSLKTIIDPKVWMLIYTLT